MTSKHKCPICSAQKAVSRYQELQTSAALYIARGAIKRAVDAGMVSYQAFDTFKCRHADATLAFSDLIVLQEQSLRVQLIWTDQGLVLENTLVQEAA
jgi:hypothetical protein